MVTKMPSVLIVILNYRTYKLTLQLIDELNEKLEYDNYEIMVVDNHSPNESARILDEEKNRKHFIFYANDKNAGYAVGNNIGIKYGYQHGYKYTWIVNNDIKLREKNVLKHMVYIAEKEPMIACVGPKILASNQNPVAPYCKRPTIWTMTVGCLQDKINRDRNIDVSMEVYRVYGCCMLLRNEAMNAINYMDERTFLYGEEDILAERFLLKEYKTFYDSEVSVLHNDSATIRYSLKSEKNALAYKMSVEAMKSRELYLKEYRKYPAVVRLVCHKFRKMILRLKGFLQ